LTEYGELTNMLCYVMLWASVAGHVKYENEIDK